MTWNLILALVNFSHFQFWSSMICRSCDSIILYFTVIVEKFMDLCGYKLRNIKICFFITTVRWQVLEIKVICNPTKRNRIICNEAKYWLYTLYFDKQWIIHIHFDGISAYYIFIMSWITIFVFIDKGLQFVVLWKVSVWLSILYVKIVMLPWLAKIDNKKYISYVMSLLEYCG